YASRSPEFFARFREAVNPHSGSRRMALACFVRTSVTSSLNSSMSRSLMSPPFSLPNDFFSEPRWSIAAAAITPRLSETAFMPAILPGVNFIGNLQSQVGNKCRPQLRSLSALSKSLSLLRLHASRGGICHSERSEAPSLPSDDRNFLPPTLIQSLTE